MLESISPRKTTALGPGYFVTWVTSYRTADGEVVGRQLFRIFKFDPRIAPDERRCSPRTSEIAVGDELPPFELALTATLIVAGASPRATSCPRTTTPRSRRRRARRTSS